MKRVTQSVPRFGHLHAWANRVLYVDLSRTRIEARETVPLVPSLLGARGIAARICWDLLPSLSDPFHPSNPLVVAPGALTGSSAPYSGRTVVCAFSPQGYPQPWFTRSSVGGWFGGELKRAGYDALVVMGASEEPVRILIQDDEVSLLPAGELWGLDTGQALNALRSTRAGGSRSLVIGPAGERLSRIATIHTASSSACGQGGMGAVMGSKRLKAITVAGTGRVTLAHPERVAALARAIARRCAEDGRTGPLDFFGDVEQLNRLLATAGEGRATCQACTEGCVTPCAANFHDMPGPLSGRKSSGAWVCVGTRFLGFEPGDPSPLRSIYDWQLPRSAAFELNVLSNRYGLNQSDLIGGLVPWLVLCQKAGLTGELDGRPMEWSSPEFWAALLNAIAYRQGTGDALAEGGWRAARMLGLGEDLARRRYPGWGYASHCDGLEGGCTVFPYWLVSALQWLADSRDPFDSGHGYLWAEDVALSAAALPDPAQRPAALDRLRAVGQRAYGSSDAVDPCSGYRGKAAVGHYQMLRSAVKDCLPVDAHFPLIYRQKSPDGLWRLEVDGLGEIEGPALEHHLFAAGTGLDWTEDEFMRAAQRVCTMERAVQVRAFGRDRRTDETVLPYFEQTELWQNPWLERRHGLDCDQFRPVMDEFYWLLGWDVESGRPTRQSLRSLGLGELFEPMLVDAACSTPDRPAGCLS